MTISNRAHRHRVLVVDGDPTNAKLLKFLLEDDGYEVTIARSATDALELLATQQHELVTLDTDLPGSDGMELCRHIRSRSSVPIIIISGRAAVEDRVAGLRSGADDYVCKPFDPGEVLARIWALFRRARPSTRNDATLSTGDLKLDPIEAKVSLVRTDRIIDLTPLEVRLLRFLVANAGRALSRDALIIKVWGNEAPSTSNQLDVYISRLRSKIEEDPGSPRLIVTVRGIGYKYQPGAGRPLTA